METGPGLLSVGSGSMTISSFAPLIESIKLYKPINQQSNLLRNPSIRALWDRVTITTSDTRGSTSSSRSGCRIHETELLSLCLESPIRQISPCNRDCVFRVDRMEINSRFPPVIRRSTSQRQIQAVREVFSSVEFEAMVNRTVEKGCRRTRILPSERLRMRYAFIGLTF
jgi:hypothetical protein